MQAKKTLGENAALEIGTDFTLDESRDGRSLLARVGEECLEALSDDFVKKRLLRLVALVVGQVDPVRDRVGVEIKCRRIASVGGGSCKQPPFPSRCGLSEAGGTQRWREPGRSRRNIIRDHGVLAPGAKWRGTVVRDRTQLGRVEAASRLR